MREIWRTTALAWQTLRGALLPLAIADLAAVMPRFLAHLCAHNEHCRPRRVQQFLEMLWRDDG